ncbi:MAG: hypothetical protein ACKO5X_06595 [Limnohabitans sp.]
MKLILIQQVLYTLEFMDFSFSKPDFKSGLRATGSMMTGNACVAFLILGKRNWENLVLLMVIGLSLILLTTVSITFSKDSPHD